MRAVGFCKKHLASWHQCKKQHLIKANPRRVSDKKYVLCLVRASQYCADHLHVEGSDSNLEIRDASAVVKKQCAKKL